MTRDQIERRCPAPKCERPMYLGIFTNGSCWICPVHGRSGTERRGREGAARIIDRATADDPAIRAQHDLQPNPRTRR